MKIQALAVIVAIIVLLVVGIEIYTRVIDKANGNSTRTVLNIIFVAFYLTLLLSLGFLLVSVGN